MTGDTMRTVADLLRGQSEAIKADAKALLIKHSVSKRYPPPSPFTQVHVVRTGSHYWDKLSLEGQRIAAKLRERYRRFADTLRVFLRSQDARTVQQLAGSRNYLCFTFIDQIMEHGFQSGQAAFDRFAKELDAQVGLLEKLYDGREGEHIYVPDTNALIYYPKLEDWVFDESPQFTLVLTPTVLAELDELKINRNEDVREKAKKIISQIKDYRRRGDLTEGVAIRKNKISLRTVAVEPDFDNTLPWLDRANNDDRILAGFIEVMRQHPRCPVSLVTADINLANKADYAGLPCVEPPERLQAVT